MSAFSVLRNGVRMPIVGLGTWQLRGDACALAVRHSLEVGVQLVDTAAVYRNEEIVGAELVKLAVKDSSFETANNRGVFVTTKVGPRDQGFDAAYSSCLESLRKLQQPAVDLLLIHWPGKADVPPDSPIHRKMRHETWRAFEKLYKEGKCRSIGVSNFLARHLKELIEDGVEVVPMVDQIEIHPLCPNWELRKVAEELGIVLTSYSSLGTGDRRIIDHPVVREVAEAEKRTPAEILLRWCVQSNITIIPRSENPTHMAANLEVTAWQLSEDSMAMLNDICPPSQAEFHCCWDPNTIA